MKINDINRINGINKTYQNQAEFRKEDRKSMGKDEVQISQAAQEMLETSRVENSERTQYLDELKQAVQSGTYYVESGKIAEKLLPFFK
ncbi:MAG: flagellar biosynthesis anti-sigma factor FlgM [Candidatus Pristimantibacillus lignocellulolyticus]|uniref:Negative regulator of flagellin synthesis n=1 Tax=Candidatus Pristimantibacillus lignocellulolyticus TaxID=2994561 RepID=A0A9J6ZK76_9BACL|nr:MAG: flagellar biosynthesis anti-sigma factor FlgM [Candidatus Pristimantibacillus lignocellulolyticus]